MLWITQLKAVWFIEFIGTEYFINNRLKESYKV